MARFLRLKSISIQGFKSFYGRTRFEFPLGITAVVGPNGCGKSNIGDAISWVLGEQKASSLRSDRMEDVIFNGTQGRKPLGMAEVSLEFGNLRVDAHGDVAARDPDIGTSQAGNGHDGHVSEASETAPEAGGESSGGNGSGGTIAAGSPEATEQSDRPLEIPLVEELQTAGGDPDESAVSPGSPTPAENGGVRVFLEDLADEIVVTRRLYRSGESEYILNGQRCRLKDIQDLLSRTEIGTRLYSIIEQGRIDQVLSAKPKDRRAIIEEAAGIHGYKLKRRQAEVKLEAAHANLLRIADIASEVEKQINSLRRQAGKARRYRRLLETLRQRRAVLAYRRLVAIDAEHIAAKTAIDELRTAEAATAAGLAGSEADVELLRRKLDEGEEGARGRRDRIHAIDMEIDRLQGRLRGGEEQSVEMRRRIDDARGEIDRLCGRVAEFQARRETMTGDLAAEAERLLGIDHGLSEVDSRRDEQAREIARRDEALEATRSSLMETVDGIAAMQRTRAGLEEQLRSGRATITRLEREVTETSAAREAALHALCEFEAANATVRGRIEEHGHRRDALQAEESAASERLASAERHAEERKGRSATLTERLLELRELERQHAGFGEGVGELLRGAAGFAPRGVVGECIQVPQGLERAVAAALGELCEAVLISEPNEATQGIAHLRLGAAGRVSFVRENASTGECAPEMPADLAGRSGVIGLLRERINGLAGDRAVDRMLARAVLVERLDLAIALQGEYPGWDFVTAEGDIARGDGVITGGDGPELHYGVLARRAELAELEGRVAESGVELTDIERRIPTLRNQLEECRATLEAATTALQEEEKEMFQGDVLLQQKQAELERLDRAGPMLLSEQERILREVLDFEAEMERLSAELAVADSRREEMDGSIRGDAEDLAGRRQRLEEVRNESATIRAELAAGRQRHEALGRERDTLDEAMRETSARGETREAECIECQERIASLGRQEIELKVEQETALESRAGLAAEEESAMAGLAYDRSLLHARDQAAREGRNSHEKLRQQVQERELTLARLTADLEHLTNDCREDLGTTPEALRASPPEFDTARPVEEDAAEVAELKTSLESIGPVNLMAIEQCSELEERFGFMSEQRKDLDDAIASLRETIRKINRESRQRFMAAFEAIQIGFQECFTTLFGGGRSELRLQDGEEDVLEAGIEIAAQPPGKKLQSLTLLSGGEKALTAVALLFALFRYRPSPFCVLDEVDAPLDEANVERFTRMLQQLTDETQFIMITHNRKSMEAADLLYGITMEEPGVSKVLPLRFE